ncbi:MAG: prepilin peptidase [Candidatus Woesearchaeota archaeon]
MDLASVINLAFIIPLFIIGLYGGYIDIKKGIIPNKLILIGFLWGVVLYSTLFLLNIFSLQNEAFFAILPKVLINSTLGLLVGYLLWYSGFWSAGDGKIFALYSFLIPLEFYSESYIDYFPSFVVLVNLFVPLIILIGLKALFSLFSSRKEIKEKFKDREFLNRSVLKSYGQVALTFITDITMVMVVIRGLMMVFEKIFSTQPIGFIIFALLVILMYGFRKAKEKYPPLEVLKYLIIFIFFGNLIIQSRFDDIVMFLRMIAIFAIFIGLLKQILLFYVANKETEKIKAQDVKKGMVLTKEWKEYFSEKISKLKKNDKHEHFESISGGGLSKRQAEILRELFEEDDKYYVEICKTLPFAPFLFFAFIVLLIPGFSFTSMLNNFFMYFINY